MSERYRTKRLCSKCGNIYMGRPDSSMCSECTEESRIQNVVRERTCIDCGCKFKGGPRARRCPQCREIAKKENSKHRKGAPIRPLGSLDSCQLCGEQYTVVGGRQKYCPNCQHDAILAWQRPHKISYNKRPDVIQTKKERRNERKKICVYCLRPFWDSTASNLCSDYCRKQQFRMQQYLREIKRENNCNIQALEESREKYREKVKNENNIL